MDSHGQPIFLFGMPRSGTTWIGKIFDSHPRTLYRHEPDSWSPVPAVPLAPRLEDAPRYADHMKRFVASIASMTVPKVCAKTPIFKKDYQTSAAFQLQKMGVMTAKLGGRLSPGFPVFGTTSRVSENVRLVWKSIESLARLGVFLDCFPNARAIHIVRHPCGYVSSVLRGEQRSHFEDNSGASEDYGIYHLLMDTDLARKESLDLQYLAGLTPVERLAWRWVLFNEKAVMDCANTGRVMVVSYDDLCRDPIVVSQEMFEFAGLDWAAQTQEFLLASTSKDDGAYYGVFKDPLAAASRWQQELSEENQRRIMAVVAKGSLGRRIALQETEVRAAGFAGECSS